VTRVQALWRENRGGPSSRAAQLEAVRRPWGYEWESLSMGDESRPRLLLFSVIASTIYAIGALPLATALSYGLFPAASFEQANVAFMATAFAIGCCGGLIFHALVGGSQGRSRSWRAAGTALAFGAEGVLCVEGWYVSAAGAWSLRLALCIGGPILWGVGWLIPIAALGGVRAIKTELAKGKASRSA